jgi:threonine aldolase
MRFVSAQLLALFEDDARVALTNARHANAMAKRLYEGVVQIAKKHKEVKVPNPTEANAVFPILPALRSLRSCRRTTASMFGTRPPARFVGCVRGIPPPLMLMAYWKL